MRERTKATIRAVLLVFAALPFFLLAFYLSQQLVNDVWLAQASKNWPSAAGFTVNTSIAPGPRSRGNIPRVNYVYVIEGTLHHGNRVQFGHLNGSPEWANSVVARYPVGPVRVYYAPSDRNLSVLEPGRVKASTYFGLAATLASALPGIYCLFRAAKQLRKAPSISIERTAGTRRASQPLDP